MANRIQADTEKMEYLASRLQRISRELTECANAIGRVRPDNEEGGKVRVNLSGRLECTGAILPDGQVSSILTRMRNVMNGAGHYADDMADQLRAIANLFEDCENEIAGMNMDEGYDAPFTFAGKISPAIAGVISDYIRDVWGDVVAPGVTSWLEIGYSVIQDINNLLIYGNNDAFLCIGDQIISTLKIDSSPTSFKVTQTLIDGLSKIETEAKMGLKFLGKKTLLKADPDEYTLLKEGEMPLKGRLSLLTVEGKLGASYSALHGEYEISDDRGFVKAEGDVMKFESEAGFQAGLYAVKEDANGNKVYVLSPGAQVKAGISVTAFEGNVSSEYEIIDNVKVKSNLTATAGKVGVEGEMQIGKVDGKWAAYAGVEAEAIAAEIKGDIGIDVAGIEGKIGAELNVGIGAHADVGFHDGKLSFDIGATIGIGGSISAEIDVGGLVDNVVEGADKFIDGAVEVGSNIIDGAKEIGGNIVDGAKEIGSNIAEGAKDFLDWIF